MSDYQTARAQYENYRYCYDNGHDTFVKKAKVCFDFWNGNQWDPHVKARLEREGRPALTFNVIESLVKSMKGIQRALRNDVRYMPVQDANAEAARVRDSLWLHVQNRNSFDFLESDMYEKGLIMSRSYVDIRLGYDESLQGNIILRPRRSQDVVLDPAVDEYDPDSWPQVITRRWVSYNDIYNLYGKEKAEQVGRSEIPSWYDYEDLFMAQQMGSMPYYHHASLAPSDLEGIRAHLLLERQYFVMKRKEVFIDLQTGDFSEIPEDWDRARISHVLENAPGVGTMRRDVKTIRWEVTCEDEVMHAEDSIFNHFTVVPFFPTFVDGTCKGAVESLIDPQQLYNKMTSSELHIISTTANSGYKVKTGSLKNMTPEELEANGAKSGFVVELDDIANLEKIQPNQIPAGHDRLSFKADQIMRSLSGVSNQARGFAREDVAGEAILANQAAQDINFAGYLTNLHRTKQLIARNVLDIAQQHYTEERVLLINRGTSFSPKVEEVTLNQMTPEGLVVNDITRGKFSTVLVPSPSRTTMSEEDFGLLLKLRTEVGVAIPDNMLIELSPASNKAEIIQMLSGGPDSNERQRQAEELAAQQQAVDAEKAMAAAENSRANATLAQARAEKFAVETASDPDASYERVEMARLDMTDRHHDDEMELEREKLQEQRRTNQQQTALKLSAMDIDREERAADRDVAKQERRPAARREKKPGATKQSA